MFACLEHVLHSLVDRSPCPEHECAGPCSGPRVEPRDYPLNSSLGPAMRRVSVVCAVYGDLVYVGPWCRRCAVRSLYVVCAAGVTHGHMSQ